MTKRLIEESAIRGDAGAMNIVSALARTLRGGQMMHEDAEERFVIRLKEADKTNDSLERRIVKLSDGSSIAEILRRLTEGLDQVWATWIRRYMPEALQNLEQRGFIRVENRPRTEVYVD